MVVRVFELGLSGGVVFGKSRQDVAGDVPEFVAEVTLVGNL